MTPEDRTSLQFWSELRYPTIIVNDRYGGIYSGGAWTAFMEYSIPPGAESDDISCAEFWANYGKPCGMGDNPQSALDDLETKVHEKLETESFTQPKTEMTKMIGDPDE